MFNEWRSYIRRLYLKIKVMIIKPDCRYCSLSCEPSWSGKCEICDLWEDLWESEG